MSIIQGTVVVGYMFAMNGGTHSKLSFAIWESAQMEEPWIVRITMDLTQKIIVAGLRQLNKRKIVNGLRSK